MPVACVANSQVVVQQNDFERRFGIDPSSPGFLAFPRDFRVGPEMDRAPFAIDRANDKSHGSIVGLSNRYGVPGYVHGRG